MRRRTAVTLLLASAIGLALLPIAAQEHGDDSFCLVALPDTQLYVERTPEILAAQIEWIIHNRGSEKIAFVAHLGDIVDDNIPEQWETADRILSRLDGVVPYGLCVGNHDMVGKTGDASLFQEHFPARRYGQYDWYGGNYRNNANSYQLFSAGGLDFIILHLECNAPDDVLQWADNMLSRNADRQAIIATHMYLGARTGVEDTEKGRCLWKKCHGDRGNTPQQMWEKCFSQHANIFLIISGDQSTPQVYRQTSTGVHGNLVHEVLSDYKQAESAVSGYLRIYRFRPAENRIEVKTYSPNLHKFCEGTKLEPDPGQHAFDLPYNMTGAKAAQAEAAG